MTGPHPHANPVHPHANPVHPHANLAVVGFVLGSTGLYRFVTVQVTVTTCPTRTRTREVYKYEARGAARHQHSPRATLQMTTSALTQPTTNCMDNEPLQKFALQDSFFQCWRGRAMEQSQIREVERIQAQRDEALQKFALQDSYFHSWRFQAMEHMEIREVEGIQARTLVPVA